MLGEKIYDQQLFFQAPLPLGDSLPETEMLHTEPEEVSPTIQALESAKPAAEADVEHKKVNTPLPTVLLVIFFLLICLSNVSMWLSGNAFQTHLSVGWGSAFFELRWTALKWHEGWKSMKQPYKSEAGASGWTQIFG